MPYGLLTCQCEALAKHCSEHQHNPEAIQEAGPDAFSLASKLGKQTFLEREAFRKAH